MSQEKLQTMVMQKFWGVIEAYYWIVQGVNGPNRLTQLSYLTEFSTPQG